MWADVGTWVLVVALVWVLFLFIRHGKRLSELNAEDRTAALEREQADALLVYEGVDVDDLSDTLVVPLGSSWAHNGKPVRAEDVEKAFNPEEKGNAEYLKAKTMAAQTIAAVAGDWDASTQVTAKQDLTVPIVAENVRTIERPQEKRRLRTVEDELGVWTPSAHQVAQPEILGDVLAWRKWATIRPAHLGMVTA